jgi:hypothetical protein
MMEKNDKFEEYLKNLSQDKDGDNDGDEKDNYNMAWNSGALISSSSITNWSAIKNSLFEEDEDLTKIFVKIVKHLSEEDISKMLDSIKQIQHANYLRCLVNLLMYPNFKPMSEKFIIDRYEDLKFAREKINSMKIDFELVYGEILDNMPSLRLLLEIDKNK